MIAGLIISIASLRRCCKEIVFFIVLLSLLLFYFFIKEDSLREYHSNIVLFLIATYLLYLASRTFYLTSKYHLYNKFVIWTYDNMDIIPFLKVKDNPDRLPDVKKEKEMINLWKWSLIRNLKEIFSHMSYNGCINETHRKNEEYVENLIAAITASEWEDPSILYLSANVWKTLGFLRIGNCSVIRKKSENKERYQNARKAAEKWWEELTKKFKEKEKKNPKSDREKQELECEIKKLRNEIIHKRCEIINLRILIACINEMVEVIDEKNTDNLKFLKKITQIICSFLINIYTERSHNFNQD